VIADSRERYPPIADYAVIGDGRTAALIGRDGALEWWCLPRFDGAAMFAAILDRDRGGRFAVGPTRRGRATRRYLPGTNVLETTFEVDGGRARLTDFMPALAERDKRAELGPEREILRLVECEAGEVEIEVACDPRPDYGLREPRPDDRGPLGVFWANGREALVLRSEIPLAGAAAADGAPARPSPAGVRAVETLRAGDRRWVSLSYTDGDPAVLAVLGDVARRKLERTVGWWRGWSSRCSYEGPFADAVERSALTIKLLAFAPSGAIVAALTTSLPEAIGGVRNWDYRYCWLRDASLTVQALMDLGYSDEATAFLAWILHSTRLGWTDPHILYDLYGRKPPRERTLDHLEGYAGSRPVRVGNAARNQLQLDIYGEVADAVAEYMRRGGRIDRATRRMLARLGERVCELWREPDESIWEIRAGRRHHTYSRVMCWVALDRLIALHEAGHIDGDVERFRAERAAIRDEVEARGWNDEIQSYVAVLDGDEVDASLLLLDRYHYADSHDPRVRATCARVHERLGAGPLLYRYLGDDGLPPGEGAFGIASFWGVGCRARQGDLDAAAEMFEAILGYANDVGLFAEEIDPGTGAHLGNFPQGFTHVGLIDAALTIAELRGEAVERSARAARLELERATDEVEKARKT
jgi:GH15 family glucan-1,4-alpha-glucosidase